MSELPIIEAVPTTTVPKSPSLKCLIIDTNAIINGTSLRHIAEEFYTCPEVIAELRSAYSREYLERLPFELKVQNPTEDALKFVVEFSKKTGDYGVLSIPDLKVLALTYTLEKKLNGDANIRKEPLVSRPSGALPSAPPPKSFIKNPAPPKIVDADGWEVAVSHKKNKNAYGYSNKNNAKSKKEEVKQVDVKQVDIKQEDVEKEDTKKEDTENVDTKKADIKQGEEKRVDIKKENDKKEDNKSIPSPVEPIGKLDNKMGDLKIEAEHKQIQELFTEEDDSEDEGGEWITPDNVDEFKAAEIGVTADELRDRSSMAVGCMTADFAMQNVLLQMNLNLVSAGGYRVKKIRNSVMRCHACFTVTNDLEKKFCPKCGNASLQRVTCSTNSKGQIQYHLKKNFQYRLRGTKYDIPLPKGGRKTNNIVLREDQRDYIKAMTLKSKKKAVDMFDPDFIPLYGKLDTREVTNNMFGTDTIGYGRKNPNASKKRVGKKKIAHRF
ncbi:Nin one binding Zn-ribbon like-domain-containing protein [Pilobolus umbonatus]|nr:Nin one binding Zn-ribbon like-domain-containing protein [Pilobolus umbonatus]